MQSSQLIVQTKLKTKVVIFLMSILHFSQERVSITANRAFCLALCSLLFLTACDTATDDNSEAAVQLTPPTTVSASFVDANTLEISWSAVSGASEYKVYMDDNQEAASIGYIAAVGSGTSFTKGDLEASTKYWFWVKACTSPANADCSAYSAAAEGDTTPEVVEIAPSDFSATAGSDGITLSWSAKAAYSYDLLRSEDDCISSLEDLDSYSVLCSESKLDIGVSPDLVDSDLSSGLIYYYWLEAADSTGNRDYVSSGPISLAEAEFSAGEVVFSKFFTDGLDFVPAVDESASRLYVASGSDLYAIDAISGREKWSTPFVAGGIITAAPILDATGNIYISAAENSGNVVHKVSSSGELQWSSAGDNSVTSTGVADALALIEYDSVNALYFANGSGAIFSATNLSDNSTTKMHTMANGVVGAMATGWYGDIFLGDKSDNLAIVLANGTDSTVDLGETLVTAPALDSSQNIYFATSRRMYSYTSSGSQRWQSAISAGSVSPILGADGSSVLQADNDTLYKLSSSDGSEIWSYGFSGNVYNTTPAIDTAGNIYVGLSRGGEVVVLTNDGTLASTYATGKSAGVSTPLRLSSKAKLYFGAGDWLFALQAEAQVSQESPWPQYKGNVRNTAFISDSFAADNLYARAELDNDSLVFLEDENGKPWISDDKDYTISASSMRSPDIDNSQTACIRAIANKSGSLSFYWKVSSEKGYDFLRLDIVGSGSTEAVKTASISGSVDWQQKSGIDVNYGEELRWCYAKDNSDPATLDVSDSGWLDDVQIQ